MSSSKARLALSKSISALTAKQDAFTKAVESLKLLNEEALLDLDLQIEQKTNEITELEKKLKNDEIDEKIRIDQDLKKYGYEAAEKIIEEHGKVAMYQEDYDDLKTSYDTLVKNKDEEIKKIREEEHAKHKKELNACISNIELKYKAEHAELNAKVAEKDNEVKLLNRTIDSLRDEIKLQRELTKEVAVAAKQSAIQQSFGKV